MIKELLLPPQAKYVSWQILVKYPHIFALGKYFYIGMSKPRFMPKSWSEVDCHLLGMLTEASCTLLKYDEKNFIEYAILGSDYKEYRRSILMDSTFQET